MWQLLQLSVHAGSYRGICCGTVHDSGHRRCGLDIASRRRCVAQRTGVWCQESAPPSADCAAAGAPILQCLLQYKRSGPACAFLGLRMSQHSRLDVRPAVIAGETLPKLHHGHPALHIEHLEAADSQQTPSVYCNHYARHLNARKPCNML